LHLNLGKGIDLDQPLQHRVSSLEDTLESVHTTVANLESTMGDIVKLLKGKATPGPAPARFPMTPTPMSSSPATVINHSTHPITTIRLSYQDTTRQVATPISPTATPMSVPPPTNRGLRPNGLTENPAAFDSDLKSPMGQRQHHRQEYISGHYWHACQFDIHHDGKGYMRFQVAWLHHNIDGPYEGKPDKLQNITLSLARRRFYQSLSLLLHSAQIRPIGACGYHEALLPTRRE
jgi:hypothetical protein